MHLEKLPSGSWRVTVHLAGQRRRGTAPTKNEARRAGARLLAELEANTPDSTRRRRPGTHSTTMAQLLDMQLVQAEYSATTLTDLRRVLDRLPATFTAMPVTDVTVADLDALYGSLTRAGWSPHRIRRAHNLISVSMDRARRWQWITRNPARDARPPRPVAREPQPAAPADVAKVLALLADEPPVAAFVRVAATTGARRGELCGLRWADIDLEAGRLTIARSVIYTPDGGVQEKDTKTGRQGRRVVALDADTVTVLRRLRAYEAERLLAGGVALEDHWWVFGGHRPWRPDYISRRWAQACDAAGVTGVRLHDLRHLVATQLIAAGVDVRRVAGRLGHARTSTTLDTYSHWLPDSDQEAADIIAARLRGA